MSARADSAPISAAPVEGCPHEGITFLAFYEDGVRVQIELTDLPRSHGACTICSSGISPSDGAIAMDGDLICAECAAAGERREH